MKLMTQSDFAAHRGVGKSAVSNWKKAGLLILAENDDGRLLVDVERTEARLNARLDPMRGRPSSSSPASTATDAAPAAGAVNAGPTLLSIRADKLSEDLIAQRLKNAAAAGDLVVRADVERRYAEAMRMLRERLQGRFRGTAERLAAETDRRAMIVLAEQLIDGVFAEVADEVDAGTLDDDGDDDADDADESEDLAA